MRRRERWYVLVYVGSFVAALLIHGVIFAGFRRLPDSDAVITVQAGDVWIEVEFAQQARPEPAKPPPPEKVPEPLPIVELPEPPVEDLSIEEPLKPVEPEPVEAEPVEKAPEEPEPEVVEEAAEEETDTAESAEEEEKAEEKVEEAAGEAAAYLRTPEEGARQVRIVGSSKPRYPVDCQRGLHRADRRPCQGESMWLVEVLPNGRIGEIQLAISAGCRHLDEAVRKWLRTEARAVPAIRNGRPVREVQELTVRFDL